MKAAIRNAVGRVSEQSARRLIAEWAVTLVMLLFGTTTVVQAFVIPSGSMEGTLLVGDHLLVDKLVYAPSDSLTRNLLPYRDVRRGDVIVFRYPLDLNKTLVKRAIGVPGDRVRLENKRLILNGLAMDEPYARHIDDGAAAYRDNFPSGASMETLRPRVVAMLEKYAVNGELLVPHGFILALGDNRENSDDSRFWGLVPLENIIGTPVVIYWSFDASTEDLSNPNIDIRHLIDMGANFFTRTRWARTGKLLRAYPLQRQY